MRIRSTGGGGGYSHQRALTCFLTFIHPFKKYLLSAYLCEALFILESLAHWGTGEMWAVSAVGICNLTSRCWAWECKMPPTHPPPPPVRSRCLPSTLCYDLRLCAAIPWKRNLRFYGGSSNVFFVFFPLMNLQWLFFSLRAFSQLIKVISSCGKVLNITVSWPAFPSSW